MAETDMVIFCTCVVAVAIWIAAYSLGHAHGRLEEKERSNG